MDDRRRRRGGDDEDVDIEEGLEYGVRRSRRQTNFAYREFSSLSPGDFMERDSYLSLAEDFLLQSQGLAITITTLLLQYCGITVQLAAYNAFPVGDILRAIQTHLRETILALCIPLQCAVSYGTVAMLYVEDLTFYARPRMNWNTRYPKKNRTIDDISARDAYHFTGFYKHQLRSLLLHWRVPATFRHERHIYTGEECFLLYWHAMSKGDSWTAMVRDFGGDSRHYTHMFRAMVNHLYDNFYHKISGTSLSQWLPSRLRECRYLIWNSLRSNAIEEEVRYDGRLASHEYVFHNIRFESFRIFAFGDDYAMPSDRVGDEPARREGFTHDIQRAYYSAYFREHGLKAQVVYLPIGIIGSVYIASMRHNDNGILNMSGLNQYLVRLLRNHLVPVLGSFLFPCVYVDCIFAVLACICPRYRNANEHNRLLNLRLSGKRQCIEHVFADHKTRFKIFQSAGRIRLFSNGEMVRKMALMSFFSLNCYYCINETRCGFFQGSRAPTLAEYLPLDEVLQPPPTADLGDVWDYGQGWATDIV